MKLFKSLSVCVCVIAVGIAVQGKGLALNEYNAVDSDKFLRDGGSDSYFGTVLGNGGDWFELVVIVDHLDITDYEIEVYTGEGVDRELDETLKFKNEDIWKDLRAGTIITIAEDVPDDLSYDPAGGDWWINVQAHDDASGTYISSESFKVNNDNWQIKIIAGDGTEALFGEGVGVLSGVNDQEVGKLEEDPSGLITALSNYNDGKSSTFGSENVFDGGTTMQDFSSLRVPEPTGVVVLGLGVLGMAGRRR